MFLFNTFTSLDSGSYRRLTNEITAHLLRKKQARPDIAVDFITDNINRVYGGDHADQLEQLQAAGINVIYTDLRKLRDSNFLKTGKMFFKNKIILTRTSLG